LYVQGVSRNFKGDRLKDRRRSVKLFAAFVLQPTFTSLKH